MASNQTTNYNLNQWAVEDRVLREEFNRDNANIDAALAAAGNCYLVQGTYVGTGTVGKDHPNSITFDGKAALVIIMGGKYHAILVRSSTEAEGYIDGSARQYVVTWTSNSVSWYNINSTQSPESQLNGEGITYYYVALL